MLYAMILFDLKDSKKMSDENRFQAFLKMEECMKIINKKFEKYLIFPVEITNGDSLQGLFKKKFPKEKVIKIVKSYMGQDCHVYYSIDTLNEKILKDPEFKSVRFQTGPALWNILDQIEKDKEDRT